MDRKPRRPAGKPNTNRKGMKNAGFVALIILFGLIIVAAYNQPSSLKEIPSTTAISDANKGKYSHIQVVGANEMDITKKGDSKASLKAYVDPNASLKEQGLDASKVSVTYKSQSSGSSAWVGLASSIIPVVLIA